MSNILDFEFEELPLVIHNGIPAALINGMAEIEYTHDGEWMIIGINVEGHQKLTPEERAIGKKPWVYVEAPPVIAAIIDDRLNEVWASRIYDAVREQLEQDRVDAEEQRADYRRDERMGL